MLISLNPLLPLNPLSHPMTPLKLTLGDGVSDADKSRFHIYINFKTEHLCLLNYCIFNFNVKSSDNRVKATDSKESLIF